LKKFAFLIIFSFSTNIILGQTVQISKDSLRSLIQIAKEDTLKVNLLCELSYKYTWSHPDTALIHAKEALNLAEKLVYKEGIYRAQEALGRALYTLGNYPAALEYALNNNELSKKFNDPEMKVGASFGLAGIYQDMGDSNNHMHYLNKALTLARQYRLEFEEGLILIAIGKQYLEENQPDSALFYLRQSYRLINNWPSQPKELGNAYLQKNNYDSAVYWYGISISLAIKNETEQDFVDMITVWLLYKKRKIILIPPFGILKKLCLKKSE
jgi:tetratricopeptide (TPR) repeat protein